MSESARPTTSGTQIRGTYEFPALRGKMGSREFFVVLLPLSVVPTIIESPRGAHLPPEVRAQRKLNERRIPEITRYILDHEDDWLFSSLTASFDEEADFVPLAKNPNVGTLRFPLTTRLLINDGQHRRAAIQRALDEDPTLGGQTISVVLFPGESLERNQQMFSDLNRTVQKTSRSLDIMYDHRDPLNQITLAVAERVPLLQQRVEKEAQSLALRSPKFITISALYDMIAQYIGPIPESATEDQIQGLEDELVNYLNRLTGVIEEWKNVAEGILRPAEARMEYINAHAVFFFAIGAVGHVLRATGTVDRLPALRDIDWRRTNKEWQGVIMLGPDIVTRRQTRSALRQQLLYKLGLEDDPPKRVLYQ
jgi:DNA sulfur modification protein DndB